MKTSENWNLNPDGKELKVGSRRNQCMGCKEYFNGLKAFEMHRVGSFDKNQRRCLSREEMIEKGMKMIGEGYWASGFGTLKTVEDFEELRK